MWCQGDLDGCKGNGLDGAKDCCDDAPPLVKRGDDVLAMLTSRNSKRAIRWWYPPKVWSNPRPEGGPLRSIRLCIIVS